MDMAGRSVYNSGGSNLNSLLQNHMCSSASEPLDPFFLSGSSSSTSVSLLDTRSMMSFEDFHGRNMSNKPFFCPFDNEENGDEDLEEYNFHQPEKKRRLTINQVQFLERSFEMENKLEPERKVQLAKDLGLQPRQVAIWFQNRRARWKAKQLEKDYDALQASYNSLNSDYENLLKEKDKLKAEVLRLTDKLLLKEKEGNSEPTNVNIIPQEAPQNPVACSVSEEGAEVSKVLNLVCKQEDISSARSDIFDSDSPNYTDGAQSSSYVFEPDQSDLASQDEEDSLGKTMLPSCIYPKLEDVDYSKTSTSACNFWFPVEENAFWSWSY